MSSSDLGVTSGHDGHPAASASVPGSIVTHSAPAASAPAAASPAKVVQASTSFAPELPR